MLVWVEYTLIWVGKGYPIIGCCGNLVRAFLQDPVLRLFLKPGTFSTSGELSNYSAAASVFIQYWWISIDAIAQAVSIRPQDRETVEEGMGM